MHPDVGPLAGLQLGAVRVSTSSIPFPYHLTGLNPPAERKIDLGMGKAVIPFVAKLNLCAFGYFSFYITIRK